MIKSITNVLIIFSIYPQLKSQISQIDQNGVNPFCDENLNLKSLNENPIYANFRFVKVHVSLSSKRAK